MAAGVAGEEGSTPFFTISRKIIVGYVAMALLSIVAIAYALSSLHLQTARSERLVSVEFKTLNLLRDLHEDLLALETLEKQYLILRDSALLDLLNRRQYQVSHAWGTLSQLRGAPLSGAALDTAQADYESSRESCYGLLEAGAWDAMGECMRADLGPARGVFLMVLERRAREQEELIDGALAALTDASGKAYRITWFLAVLGIAVSAPLALTAVFSFRRAVRALLRATREISAGILSPRVDVEEGDEFGLLAREFTRMGVKLREMEQASLDANPLTRLPGNLAIDRELEGRIQRNEAFAHLYIDLDNFKAYGDRYGYPAGSEVIAWVGEMVRRVVRERGGVQDLVGHIGGDDYVVLTDPLHAADLGQQIIDEFDRGVTRFYSAGDLQAGCFVGQDRYGVERQIPLLTMSIAVVCSESLKSISLASIGEACARMKKQLKSLEGSNCLVDGCLH